MKEEEKVVLPAIETAGAKTNVILCFATRIVLICVRACGRASSKILSDTSRAREMPQKIQICMKFFSLSYLEF
jgi:hypothetical protein